MPYSHMIPHIKSLRCVYIFFPHFTGKDIEAQREEVSQEGNQVKEPRFESWKCISGVWFFKHWVNSPQC